MDIMEIAIDTMLLLTIVESTNAKEQQIIIYNTCNNANSITIFQIGIILVELLIGIISCPPCELIVLSNIYLIPYKIGSLGLPNPLVNPIPKKNKSSPLKIIVTAVVTNAINLDSNTLPLDIGCRSEEHTSELQSRQYLVCRLLLEIT